VAATRQNAFTIPFRVGPAQSTAQEPVEVQLHVSSNGGRSWELSAREKPDKSSFVFRAPHDGQYWFAIRTVDHQGAARPEVLEPQLKVIVDTVAPRLDLTASRGAAGEIVAHWQAVDPNLRPGSFTLEFQSEPNGPWQRVAVDSPPSAMRYTLSGETTWWPKANSDVITVRAEITDSAGNPAASQTVVKASGSAETGPPSGTTAASSGDPAGATRWPADRPSSEPLDRAAPGGPKGRNVLEAASEDAQWRNSRGDAAPMNSLRGPAPPTRNVSRSQPRPAGPVDARSLPTGERPRMVASRRFELEYEIDSVGASGISKVELWGTTDSGRTWTQFGVDPDNRSPMTVQVDGEGTYGFRITVQSGSGLGGQPPVSGDPPEIWVSVDLTKPTCSITDAQVSDDSSELTIRWEAADDALDVRPISISYSASAEGPWTPIAAGVENAGSYRWRIEKRVPDQVHLRLEVRDEAGNVGTYETAQPIALDRHRPEAHIRGVRVGK
jgi:hypothetical protein